MTITEATKTKCCCNCKHDLRKNNGKGYVKCECEIDGHYISYLACFGAVCELWESDKEYWNEVKKHDQRKSNHNPERMDTGKLGVHFRR